MNTTSPQVTDHQPTKLTSINSCFNLTDVQCEAERSLLSSIQKNADLVERLARSNAHSEEAAIRRRLSLLTNAYRVDSAITPTLAHVGVVLSRALRLAHPVDVFVVADPTMNALCFPSRRGHRLVMALHSGLLTRLSTQELLFVMGHEIGHSLLKHSEIPMVDFEDPNFSPLDVMKLRALSRAREISCDRFGLLACQSVRAACSALFKVTSGLSDRWISFDEHAYSRHFDELAAMSEVMDLNDPTQSHPISPLRVKALISFSESQTFATAFKKEKWKISSQQLEQEINNMLSVIAPDFSELDGKDEEEAANRFVFESVLLMILADGQVSDDEMAWLHKFAGPKLTAQKLRSDAADPQFQKALLQSLEENASILAAKLPETARAQLLQIVCDIAVCSGGVVESEFALLDRVRSMLRVPVNIAQRILRGAEESAADSAETESDSSAETQVNGSVEADGPVEPSAAESRPSDPLDAVIHDAKLPAQAKANALEFCQQLRSGQMPFDFSVKALVSWAMRSAGPRGLLTEPQAKRLAIAAIEACQTIQQQKGITVRSRSTPLTKQVRKYGPVALFSRSETVYLGLEDREYVVLSISRVNATLVVAPADDLEATQTVTPNELRKDPRISDWPEELITEE